MKLSIVTTLYYSAPYISDFYQRIKTEALLITSDYEIIFVNDGSPDHVLDLALELQKKDRYVVVIDLSRNFGHHRAMMIGLEHARGDLIYLIDCDLEEKPEWLSLFYKDLKHTQADMAFGIQTKRKGNWFERISGRFFYKLLNNLSSLNLPSNLVTARLMTQRYVKSLLTYRERELYLPGLWELTGYKQISIPVVKLNKGKSTYTLNKKVALFVNSITAFSDKPLIYIFYCGVSVCFIAAIFIIYLITRSILFNIVVSGWASLIASIWLLGGLIMLFMGIIGVYLSKVFLEVKQRPYSIIRQTYKYSD